MDRASGLSKRIQIDLPDELFGQLMRVAQAMGISNPEEAATIGMAEGVSRRKSELDDRHPNEKYVVNESLDELLENKKYFFSFCNVRHRVQCRRPDDRRVAESDQLDRERGGQGPGRGSTVRDQCAEGARPRRTVLPAG